MASLGFTAHFSSRISVPRVAAPKRLSATPYRTRRPVVVFAAAKAEKVDVFERAKKIIVEQLTIDGESVTAEATFSDDLGADSLDTVEVVMAFEEEFGIEISDEDAEKATTVGEAVKLIQQQLDKAA